MLRNPSSALKLFVVAALVLAVAGTADAQFRRPHGISIGVVTSDPGAATATLEVSLNTDTGQLVYTSYGTPTYTITFTNGLLGTIMMSASYAWGYGYLLYPTVYALEYGDSVGDIPGTTIPLVPPGTTYGSFRGEFAHTYPGPGNYTARALAASPFIGINTPAVTAGITTGRPGLLIPPGGTLVTYATYWSNTYTWVWDPNMTGTDSFILALTNSVQVDLQERAVPAVLPVGLLVLAGLLAGAGWVLLRRS